MVFVQIQKKMVTGGEFAIFKWVPAAGELLRAPSHLMITFRSYDSQALKEENPRL